MYGMMMGVLLLSLCNCFFLVNAEEFPIENRPLPGANTLESWYVFNIKAIKGSPTLYFRDIAMSFTEAKKKKLQARATIGLVGSRDFTSAIKTDAFCANQRAPGGHDLILKRGFEDQVKVLGLDPSGKATSGQMTLPQKDMASYYLIVANCGSEQGPVTMSGSIVVKSPDGYLPGTETHAKKFYGWMALCYLLLVVAWLAALVRYYQGLVKVQWVVLAVLAFGLAEAFLWWFLLDIWNLSGLAPEYMHCFASAFTALKYTSACVALVVVADGWLLSKEGSPALGDRSLGPMLVGCIMVLVYTMAFVRETVVKKRHFYELPSLPAVGPLVIAVQVVYGLISVWTLIKLSKIKAEAKDLKLENIHTMLSRIGLTLVLALLLFAFAAVFHIMDIFSVVKISWSNYFSVTDGLQQGIFTFMLGVMMFILWPKEDEQGVYLATSQEEGDLETTHIIGDDDLIDPQVVGHADDGEDL